MSDNHPEERAPLCSWMSMSFRKEALATLVSSHRIRPSGGAGGATNRRQRIGVSLIVYKISRNSPSLFSFGFSTSPYYYCVLAESINRIYWPILLMALVGLACDVAKLRHKLARASHSQHTGRPDGDSLICCRPRPVGSTWSRIF
jgi:hypothetical protein